MTRLPTLPRGCAQSWHSLHFPSSITAGAAQGSAFQYACEDTRGPATSLSSLVTGMHQCPPALWRLKSPSSLAKGVGLPGHRPGLGDCWEECWADGPSGSDLTNSSPRWSFEAILNCHNYRVSPGQWHHGVWAWLTLPGAILMLGRRCPAGEGILSITTTESGA